MDDGAVTRRFAVVACVLSRAALLRERARLLARLQLDEKAMKKAHEAFLKWCEAEHLKRLNALRDRRTALGVQLRLAVPAVAEEGAQIGDVSVKRVAIRIGALRRCKVVVADGAVYVREPGQTSYLAADTKRPVTRRSAETIESCVRASRLMEAAA